MKQMILILLLIVVSAGYAQDKQDPDFNSIMFCPTPQTLPAGSSYFRDFELFFLNYGYSLSDATNISVGTHFPVTGSLGFVTAGVKHRILNRDENKIGLAVFANGTFYDDGSFGVFGFVAGTGDNDTSYNFSLSQGYNENDSGGLIVMLGMDKRIGAGSKFIAEYMNTTAFMDFEDDGFYGFANVGVRWFGKTLSVSLTGLTPLADDVLFSFPMIAISKHW